MYIHASCDILGDEWEAMQVILDDGYLIFDGLNLGNIIVDDEKDIIFIMYSICNHHDRCNVASTKLLKSFDDGVTWSRPVNISEQIGTKAFAPGPGFGIQVASSLRSSVFMLLELKGHPFFHIHKSKNILF